MNPETLRRYSTLEALEHKIQVIEEIVEGHPYIISSMSDFNRAVEKYHLLIEETRTILKLGDCDFAGYLVRILEITNDVRVLAGLPPEDFYGL